MREHNRQKYFGIKGNTKNSEHKEKESSIKCEWIRDNYESDKHRRQAIIEYLLSANVKLMQRMEKMTVQFEETKQKNYIAVMDLYRKLDALLQ
jgi:hypothetical protein